MAINPRSVLLAGVVAGLVINASAILMVPIAGEQMTAALQARNVAPLGGGAMTYFFAQSMCVGIALVWLYAAVLPRFGPGPRTALVVSGVVWCLAYLLANGANVAFGFMPVGLTVVGTLWGFAELVVAGQVGTRLYRDG
jgi:hypothetical protein